ncbi:MAG: MerR family transcriptional regulator [Bacteroidetes bacterium]|nr:MerR family transcriptional regulator [Bacteroidota bacterium]HET6245605.1 MerR family transcriptional regulator [Bacteroidia bacterium]
MPYIEKEIEKLYYTIGEVSEMFKVNTSLIRFWEKEFEIIKPHKNNKGNRLFTNTDISNFHVIFHLVKERGFTLQGAKTKLKENQKDTVDSIEIIKSLNKVKLFLLDVKKEL